MIASLLLGVFGACLLLHGSNGDLYMHNVRGCNNRLDESTQNRRNGNRVFDSQNNNKGGYNVGDRTKKKAKDVAKEATSKKASVHAANQYEMQHFEGSVYDWSGRINMVVVEMMTPILI